MKIAQLTPGAGNMYCGNCLRDNVLVSALNKIGCDVSMVPLYLPMTLDEEDQSLNTPVFYDGISVYLEQKIPVFRFVPKFIRRLLAGKWLLKHIAPLTAKTQPSQVGDLTVSMLQGEHGHQANELKELCDWLTLTPPDIVVFSNALLLGMHDEIKHRTGAKTVCFIAGEDGFLDAMREPFRTQSWNLIADHVKKVDHLIAPSKYFAEYMERRLGLNPGCISVVPSGISLDGFPLSNKNPEEKPTQTLGYFARISRQKGVDTLVDAFIKICHSGKFPELQLKIGGGLTKSDDPFMNSLKQKASTAGLGQRVSFHPNLSRQDKIKFLESLTICVVPSRINEPAARYALESMAAATPVILPSRGALPEIVAQTGGGVIYDADDINSLVETIERLLINRQKLRTFGKDGQAAVSEQFNADVSAKRFLQLIGDDSLHGNVQ
ncbi:MAG: glycosyltransferase family 4 protein [Thermoguttaceae bacterium]